MYICENTFVFKASRDLDLALRHFLQDNPQQLKLCKSVLNTVIYFSDIERYFY